MDDLARIVEAALAEFTACADPAALENAKAKYLGKAGALTEQLKGLGKLAPSGRAAAGARINAAKSTLEDALTARRAALADAKLAPQLAAEALDVSLPGRGRGIGSLPPPTRPLQPRSQRTRRARDGRSTASVSRAVRSHGLVSRPLRRSSAATR